jgi:hypothetical protein
MESILKSYQIALCLLDREDVEEKIAHLYPKNYNRFQWWRRYHDMQELSDKAPTLQKILNGDYDYPTYFYQAQHEVYRMYDQIKNIPHPEDRVDKVNLFMERYRRLMEDSQKEEDKRFNAIKKRLSKEFKIEKEDLEQLMSEFEGSLEELYIYLKNKKNEKSTVHAC